MVKKKISYNLSWQIYTYIMIYWKSLQIEK